MIRAGKRHFVNICDGENVKRPTYKELDNKLNDARTAVERGNISLINPEAVASDAIQLGYLIENELSDVLLSVLADIRPEQYVGRRPPSRSYENRIVESELFPFRTSSSRLKCSVYLKFTLFDGGFFLISLHRNRNKGGRS